MVFVTRGDRVAQAVSLWKAVQTQEWRQDGQVTGDKTVEYSFAGIDHLAAWLTSRDDAWRAWFAEQGIEPLTVSYEELSADVSGQVGGVLRYLGLPDAGVPDPALAARPTRARRSGPSATGGAEDTGAGGIVPDRTA